MNAPLQQTFRFAPVKPRTEEPARRNLVIDAGAGTGKTTAIVAEVLKILLADEDLAAERIVLMTFTEKAAGEIADRIHGALSDLESRFDEPIVSWPKNSQRPLITISEADRERARRACSKHLSRIEDLRSQTIHSFCQTILRMFPIEANVDPQFKIVEGFERSLLYSELYDEWLDSETRLHPKPEVLLEWEVLLAHAGYLFQIRDMIFSLVERRDLLDAQHDLGDLREVEDQLLGALDAIRQANPLTFDDAQIQRLIAYVRRTPIPSDLDGWIEYLAPLHPIIREADLPKGKAGALVKDALRVLRTQTNKGHSYYDRLVSHRAAVALLALSRRFVEFLDGEKRKRGMVDFDDLLLRTAALLENESVLERVRAAYDFIFVDEFQDTDRTQARIIDRLARDRGGRHTPGRLVVVGDPKQSIYAFRRAEPEVYDAMTREMIRHGAEHRALEEQYRSKASLVEAINAMFARLFPEVMPDRNVFRPVYTPLKTAKSTEGEDGRPPIEFVTGAGSSPDAVASFIASRRGGSPKDLQQFAILFRRLTLVDDYLDALERHGVDYVLPPSRYFLERPAPVDMVAVLRAIAYPFDLGAVISAARTPYFALTDEEIAAGILEPGEGPWSLLKSWVECHHELAGHLRISELIDAVLASTSIEALYGATIDGQRAARHLEHLRRLAFEFDTIIGGSVRQFVDEIARRRREPEEMEPSLVDETRNAVRILSVHAAKGLEFETVILPDLVFTTSPSEGVTLFTIDEPPSLVMAGTAQSISGNFRTTPDGQALKKVAGERDAAELQRLFYVAVTRAKENVVFVCEPERFSDRGFFQCLIRIFGFEKATFASLWTEEPGTIQQTILPGIDASFVRLEVAEGNATLRRLRDAAMEHSLRESPLAPWSPPAAALDRVARDARSAAIARARSRNRAAGIALHRFLEIWNGADPPESLLQSVGRECGLAGEGLARLRTRVAAISNSPLLARIRNAATIGSELPICVPDASGRVVERRIDRLLREAEGDLVIDYKSGAPDESRLTGDRQQVEAYCAAISGMTGRSCRGALWYIDDEQDQVVNVL